MMPNRIIDHSLKYVMANEKLPRRKAKLQNAYPQTARFSPLLLDSAISSELLITTATLTTRLSIPRTISKPIFHPIRSVITKFSVQGGVSFPSDQSTKSIIIWRGDSTDPTKSCDTLVL